MIAQTPQLLPAKNC